MVIRMDAISSFFYRVVKTLILRPADFLFFGNAGILWYSFDAVDETSSATPSSTGGAAVFVDNGWEDGDEHPSVFRNGLMPEGPNPTFSDSFTRYNPDIDVMCNSDERGFG